MINAIVMPLLLAVSPADENSALQQALEQGEQVFNVTCATGYCHAINGGAGGGGARLAARGFDQEYIRSVVSNGRPGTAMPGFQNHLSPSDLEAVVAYVATLNGIDTPVISEGEADSGAPEQTELSAAAEHGRSLFHDALRGFARCSTCHQVQGSGVPAAEPIEQIPANAKDMRDLNTPQVATVTVAGEAMPGLLVSQSETRTLFYDLTIPPPVLRTVAPGSVAIQDDSEWRHAAVVESYSDAELELILQYLREAAGQ